MKIKQSPNWGWYEELDFQKELQALNKKINQLQDEINQNKQDIQNENNQSQNQNSQTIQNLQNTIQNLENENKQLSNELGTVQKNQNILKNELQNLKNNNSVFPLPQGFMIEYRYNYKDVKADQVFGKTRLVAFNPVSKNIFKGIINNIFPEDNESISPNLAPQVTQLIQNRNYPVNVQMVELKMYGINLGNVLMGIEQFPNWNKRLIINEQTNTFLYIYNFTFEEWNTISTINWTPLNNSQTIFMEITLFTV